MSISSVNHNHASLGWRRALWQRIHHLWFVKMVGTALAIIGFFCLYFWLMSLTAPRAVPVPTTSLDALIGVSEWALIPYGSLWLYVSLAPAFTANLGALRAYAAGAVAIVALAFAAYVVFPTVTPDPGIDWALHPMLQFLKASDAGGNAFPSLHVAFAFYTAVVLASQLRSLQAPYWVRVLNWGWCVVIIYSTLATRQHVVIDVLGGVVATHLALLLVWRGPGYALWRRWRTK